jgi:hypothetical protein
MNVIVNNEENFQTNLLIHNINTKNKHHLLDQMLTYLVFKQGDCMLESEFPTVLTPSLAIHENDKANFKALLRKY